jgi:hypothetical protein
METSGEGGEGFLGGEASGEGEDVIPLFPPACKYITITC